MLIDCFFDIMIKFHIVRFMEVIAGGFVCHGSFCPVLNTVCFKKEFFKFVII